MRKLRAAALLLAACACASSKLDVIQVGPWFEPRPWREVEVFVSRSEAARPWGGIGIIHSPRFPAASADERVPALREKARRQAAAMGADAVIVAVDSASSGPRMGVYEEPELYLSALAIKYVAETSTAAARPR